MVLLKNFVSKSLYWKISNFIPNLKKKDLPYKIMLETKFYLKYLPNKGCLYISVLKIFLIQNTGLVSKCICWKVKIL